MTWQLERILLPAVLDVVNDSLDMMATLLEYDAMEYMVLDYTDAFYKLPLHPEERKFYTAHFNGMFLNWNRIAQGSKNGPQLFGRLSAMIARLTQGVFDPPRLRLHVYIDDPIVILKGTPTDLKKAKAK